MIYTTSLFIIGTLKLNMAQCLRTKGDLKYIRQ